MNKNEFLKSLKLKGVNIIDINSTFIDFNCKIGKNTTIYPNNYIYNSTIGDNCIIEPSNFIIDSKISNDNKISFSYIKNCIIEENNNIGNYSNLKNVNLGNNNLIENFVNIENSTIKNDVTIKSSSNLINSIIGSKTLISNGVVFCSIKNKNHKTIIGEKCFVGSNVNIISPVIVGDNNYIYPGVNLYKNVENNKFISSKHELIIKDDYHTK